MLIPLTILVRESASDPPVEKHIGLHPDAIARVEDGTDEGTIHLWADGSEKPYVLAGTVLEFVEYVNSFYMDDESEQEESETCDAVPTDNV